MASSYSVLLLALSLFKPATAFWRLPCISPLVVERADPIISPGIPSGYVHTIMGGNAFSFTTTYASTQTSTCSSCTVIGDFSNYWTPALYYQHPGSFTSVPQSGGATIYYLQRLGPNEIGNLTAFPAGLRMVAGDPFKRNATTDFAGQAISYACLDYNAPPTPETPGFPTTNCPDGLRAQVFFPSCWDGVNLDSPDHVSHMSYPATAYNDRPCPESHPVHLISLFYEVVWNVDAFSGMWYGDANTQQPFVWAQGDPTGYGLHGDFLNGWDVELLQSAVEECISDTGDVEDCGVFQLRSDAVAGSCSVLSEVEERVDGWLERLPGCNVVQGEARGGVAWVGVWEWKWEWEWFVGHFSGDELCRFQHYGVSFVIVQISGFAFFVVLHHSSDFCRRRFRYHNDAHHICDRDSFNHLDLNDKPCFGYLGPWHFHGIDEGEAYPYEETRWGTWPALVWR